MKIQPVSLIISSKLIKQFKDRSKAVFPNECFTFMMGDVDDSKIVLKNLFYPTDVDKFCSPTQVSIQNNWIIEAKNFAKKHSLSLIGSIHSHPYSKKELQKSLPDRSPSEADYEVDAGHGIIGICTVLEKNNKFYANVKFWGPLVPIKLQTI